MNLGNYLPDRLAFKAKCLAVILGFAAMGWHYSPTGHATSSAAAPESASLDADARASEAEHAPASESALVDPFADVDTKVAHYVETGQVAGLSYAIWQNGERRFLGKAGAASFATDTPITDDTIFRIYSMTKPVTAMAMMILYERGIWDLDDPIEKHLPNFAGLQILSHYQDGVAVYVAPEKPPTMRQLMTHTAGFAYGLSSLEPVDKHYKQKRILESQTHTALLDKVAVAPLMFEPGRDWYYSISSDIQGAMIERWTGQSLGDFMHAEIFKPLGMTDTSFVVAEEKAARFSDIFGFPEGSRKLATMTTWQDRFSVQTVKRHLGGGGLVSTQKDFAQFLLLLANDGAIGERPILSPDSVGYLLAAHLPEGVGLWAATDPDRRALSGHSYGFGVGVVVDPLAANLPFGEGTLYWSGIAGTWFWFDPKADVFAIGMMQRYNSPYVEQIDFARDLAILTYAALAKDAAQTD